MCGCGESAGMWGAVGSYATSRGGKESEQMFISLFSAIWDQRRMSFILLQGFLCDLFEL
jgi:hypothetical protein